MMRSNRHYVGSLLTAAAVLVCSGSVAQADGGAPATNLLLQQGPYGSGFAELQLEDTTRPTPPNGEFAGAPTRPLPSVVWYPAADRNADQEEGAWPGTPLLPPSGFPLVVFGHGITSFGSEGAFVAAHLATHGYVVIAPDFPLSNGAAPGGATANDLSGQAGDVIFLTLALQDPGLQAAFPVASLVDYAHIGVLGYSLGGGTMALAGSHPSIDAVATLAPATCPLYTLAALDPETYGALDPDINKPLLILQGTTDPIVTDVANSTPFFNDSGTPKHIVRIDNGSHGGFLTSAPAIEAGVPGAPLDAVLCAPLSDILGSDPIAQACGVCANPPLAPQLPSTRQHDLTRAGVLAFFNAYLRCSPFGIPYLRFVYDAENPELDATYSGGWAQGISTCLAQ